MKAKVLIHKKPKANMENYYTDIVINKEKLSDGSPVFVAHCASLGIASQGKTLEKVQTNIKEAIELYLEEEPSKYEEVLSKEPPLFSVFEVKRSAKTTNFVR